MMRTDRNNNPAAFTVDIAKEAGLVLGTDYVQGDNFFVGSKSYYTAKLLGDPIALTIKVIDKIGFYTAPPNVRWTYIAIPFKIWQSFTPQQKKDTIAFMYGMEGGTALKHLF